MYLRAKKRDKTPREVSWWLKSIANAELKSSRDEYLTHTHQIYNWPPCKYMKQFQNVWPSSKHYAIVRWISFDFFFFFFKRIIITYRCKNYELLLFYHFLITTLITILSHDNNIGITCCNSAVKFTIIKRKNCLNQTHAVGDI